MENIAAQMVILFLLVIVGFVANRLGYTNAESDKKLSGLIFDFTCPALVLSSVMGETLPDSRLVLPLLGVSLATYLLLTPIAIFLPRLITHKQGDQGIYGFMMAFGNVGFIGYPIVSALFGQQAVFYASVLNFPNTFFVFVLGSALVSGGQRIHFNPRILYSPAMIASYLSILIVFMGWSHVPQVISQPLHLLGGITVPAALLIVGSQMAQMPLRKMAGNLRIYLTAALRLLVLPLLLFALFPLVGVDRTVVNINTVVIAMPVATYGTIMCLKYNRDMSIITQGTFITNLLSVFTIPLITVLF